MRTVDDVFGDRTCYKFKNQPVSHDILEKIYDVMKMGSTSGNSCPLRITFVQSAAEKEKLIKCLMPGNVDKTKSAPVTAIFSYDTKFYKLMEKYNPGSPMIAVFSSSEEVARETAYRNSSLQAAYFMIVARAYGLDCGPMSGFSSEAIEKEFFAGTDMKVNFICNLGYKDGENPYPRMARPDFGTVCKVV